MGIVHDLVVEPQARPLVGSVPLPGDEHIAQLALIAAALAEGTSELRKIARTEHVAAMMKALADLGVSFEAEGGDVLRVRGSSLYGLAEKAGGVSCGASLSTLSMLAGVLVAQPFRTVLAGTGPVARAGMARLADPLRRRGGQIEGSFSSTVAGEVTPPLIIGPLPPRSRLSEVDYQGAATGGHIKEALILSGLYADGPTYLRERIVSRDHLERMMQALDVPLATAGPIIQLDVESWGGKLPAFACDLPGDFSAALVLLGAATLVPGSRVCARGVGLNPTRTGSLDILRQMGAAFDVQIHTHGLGEPQGIACASHAALRAATMAGEVLARGIDDVPMLAVLAARAHGQSEISGLAELGGVEEGLLEGLSQLLLEFGVGAAVTEEGLFIEGRPEASLRATDVDCRGSARLALSGAVLGLLGDGPTRIRGVDSLPLRFPRFFGIMRALGADMRLEERTE